MLAGHPWIYHGAILRITRLPKDGDVVQVKDHRQRFLGLGFYNSESKIAIRLVANERVVVNQTFFEERIRSALALRQRHLPQATSFRVVNSEGDFLSGLIVDKYEDVLTLQTSALGMEQRKLEILKALQTIFSPRAVVERNDMASRQLEGLSDSLGLLAGALERETIVRINGLEFATDLLSSQKTGLYLDQQVNYQRVARLVSMYPGARVLDCFTFLGGFALHMARRGVAHVHGLDQSGEAIKMAEQNARRNGLSDRCSFEIGNVFDWLKFQTTTKANEKIIPPFDIIILDPPSFTRSRATVPDALRGYKEIHLRAFKLLKPGGTFVSFCCSHHVGADLFQEAILAAAFDARRILRRVATYQQGPDHPVVPSIPETEYLKGFAFEVAR